MTLPKKIINVCIVMYVLCQIVLDSIFTPKGYLEMIAFMNKYQNAVEYIMVR